MMALPDLLAVARDWAPDLIVRDSMEYAGCVVAETLGLPHASVRTDAVSASYRQRDLVQEPLAHLRELCGLPPDPEMVMLYRYLHLAGEPPGMLGPGDTYAPTTHLIQPETFDHVEGDELPGWVAQLPRDRPTVYATLGTFVSQLPEGLA